MKKIKKIAGLYLLFGLTMGVFILINCSSIFLTDGISVLTFVGFVIFLVPVGWLPYSVLLAGYKYSEYYVFSNKPVFLIIYIIAFILFSLHVIFKKEE